MNYNAHDGIYQPLFSVFPGAAGAVPGNMKKPKTFSDFEKEIAQESGTRYAPFLPDLFKQPMFRHDIEYLLDAGRRKMYREAFYILKLS